MVFSFYLFYQYSDAAWLSCFSINRCGMIFFVESLPTNISTILYWNLKSRFRREKLISKIKFGLRPTRWSNKSIWRIHLKTLWKGRNCLFWAFSTSLSLFKSCTAEASEFVWMMERLIWFYIWKMLIHSNKLKTTSLWSRFILLWWSPRTPIAAMKFVTCKCPTPAWIIPKKKRQKFRKHENIENSGKTMILNLNKENKKSFIIFKEWGKGLTFFKIKVTVILLNSFASTFYYIIFYISELIMKV